ncbi:hypothetical protein [Streptomyces roseicoloratus]|uniref:hypothetical protein n=1 Tax=Streptomyces roseicoloratus TaxID=2508722 RepID=UPI001FE6F1C3|nr:hypothetical protein [Streptomyces roseicoloratus]
MVPSILAGLLAGVTLAGCSPGGTAPPRPQPATAPPAPRAAACEVPLPAAWGAVFAAGEYRPSGGRRPALADTGPGWTALQLTGDDGRRAVLVRDGETSPRTLLRFTDPVEHQLLAADFDGRRWAAFAVLEGRTLDSPWSLYVWDAATGRSRRLTRADRPGPLPRPVVHDGTVVWAQGTGTGKATVFAAPAGGGHARAWHTGVLDTPFAAGGLLVWREAEGAHTRPAALSLRDGRPAALPAPVAALRDIRALVSDGGTWAWVEGETEPRLMVWRAGEARPPWAAVTASPAADGMDQLRIAGRLVTWRTPETSYALDPGVGSYARIAPPYGYTAADGNALVLAYSLGNAKTAGARAVIQVVDVARLPALPRCG